MAPEHIEVRITVVPAVSSTEQIEPSEPGSPKRLVDQFLAYLEERKRWLGCRCQQPVDPEPETLARTCLNCLAASRWRQRVEDFYRRTYPEAVVFADTILGDRSEAEDVVSEVFADFLEGKIESRFFFRVLKFRCLDRLKRLCPMPVGAVGLDAETFGDSLGEASDMASALDRADEMQEPGEVLDSQKKYRRLRRLISRAREIAETDRKYRWIKEKDWAKPLNLRRKKG
jgi:DNA-directed RNA polymerase specialized sigma24 family protein